MYRDYYFPTPNPLPRELVLAIPRGKDPVKDLSCICRLSPDEPVIAFVKRLHGLLQDGIDEEETIAWRAAALMTPVEYILMDSADKMYIKTRQGREDIVQDFTSLRPTSLQMTCDINYAKKQFEIGREELSAVTLAKKYEELKMAEGSEALSPNLIDTALTIYDRILKFPDMFQLLREADNEQVNPLDGHSRLQAIISKAQTIEGIRWAIQWIWTAWKNGLFHGDVPSVPSPLLYPSFLNHAFRYLPHFLLLSLSVWVCLAFVSRLIHLPGSAIGGQAPWVRRQRLGGCVELQAQAARPPAHQCHADLQVGPRAHDCNQVGIE